MEPQSVPGIKCGGDVVHTLHQCSWSWMAGRLESSQSSHFLQQHHTTLCSLFPAWHWNKQCSATRNKGKEFNDSITSPVSIFTSCKHPWFRYRRDHGYVQEYRWVYTPIGILDFQLQMWYNVIMSVNNMSKSHSLQFIQRCNYEGDYPLCVMIEARSTSSRLTARDHCMLSKQGTHTCTSRAHGLMVWVG